MADTSKICEHGICSCAATDDSDYCSAYCETAGDMTELACNCGHAGCASSVAVV